MSIASSIIEIAAQTCKNEHKSSVKKIALEIGHLAGVQYEALEFIWPIAVKGTVLENAAKTIQKTEGIAICSECNSTFPLKNLHDCCPECQSYTKQITQGKELRVKYLEV